MTVDEMAVRVEASRETARLAVFYLLEERKMTLERDRRRRCYYVRLSRVDWRSWTLGATQDEAFMPEGEAILYRATILSHRPAKNPELNPLAYVDAIKGELLAY